MRLRHYLDLLGYFFYIGLNWNFRLAFFTIRHEMRGEKKYGIITSKLNDLKKLSIKGNAPAYGEIYQGSNYFLLESMFAYLQEAGVKEHIIDYGCGKGRVLAVAAFYGFTKLTGIDFALELCQMARQNLIHVQEKFPRKSFNIVHSNAADYVVESDMNTFFFFNPFNEKVMLAVVKNILHSLKSAPREVYVVYLNPLHKEIFLSAGFEEIYHLQKMHYIEGCILKKSPEDAEPY